MKLMSVVNRHVTNGNAITINTMMREARSVGAAKILCMRQESSVNLSPFGGGGGSTAWQYQYQIFHLATGTGPISWLKLFLALK